MNTLERNNMIVWPVTVTENKYSRWYESLVSNAQNRILDPKLYFEKHHIVPKCFGGSDDDSNLVNLLAKEHYIAHLLLWKMGFPKKQHQQMLKAFHAMSAMKYNKRDYTINSRIFEKFKLEHVAYLSIRYAGENNPNFGKGMKPHVKQKLKEANLRLYQERCAKMFVGPIRPDRAFEFRGVVYKGICEASRRTGITQRTMKTQIIHWGTNPSQEIIRKIDSGELKYPKEAPNKGIPMSAEQKSAISKTKLKGFDNRRALGIPLPNIGRKASAECREKISAIRKERYSVAEKQHP
jgi:hypothetical protein